MNEFDLIKTYFQKNALSRPDVVLGIGDDAALLKTLPTHLLVVSTDTLVEGVHFPKKTAPEDLAYKALAVNLSDLAAMGADPAWFTLALTLPLVDEQWLRAFSDGLFQLANSFNLQLVGGDLTRGPLSVTLQVLGQVPQDQTLLRKGAQTGDKIYVSGTLGDAGLGLQVSLGKTKLSRPAEQFVLQRLYRPTPRIQLGQILRGLATSAIDISDGLAADLGHILTSSHVGATIRAESLPLSPALKIELPSQEAQRLALSAGDDYELCFTVAPYREQELIAKLKRAEINCSCIGEIKTEPTLDILGFSETLLSHGFQHFS